MPNTMVTTMVMVLGFPMCILYRTDTSRIKGHNYWGSRDRSVAKSTWVQFLAPTSSQPSVMSVLGYLMPTSGCCGHCVNAVHLDAGKTQRNDHNRGYRKPTNYSWSFSFNIFKPWLSKTIYRKQKPWADHCEYIW